MYISHNTLYLTLQRLVVTILTTNICTLYPLSVLVCVVYVSHDTLYLTLKRLVVTIITTNICTLYPLSVLVCVLYVSHNKQTSSTCWFL